MEADEHQIGKVKADVKLLLECLKCQVDNPSALKQALVTISNICISYGDAKDYLREIGGLEFIVNLLAMASSTSVKGAALFCLGCAAENNAYSQKLLCTQHTFAFVHNLLSARDVSVKLKQTATFLMLCLVASNSHGQMLARKASCIEDLLGLFRTALPQAHTSLQNQDAWIDDVNNTNIDLWTGATSAVCACINNPQNDDNQRIASSVLPFAIRILQQHKEPLILRSVLSLLGSICANNVDNQNRMRTCSGLDSLVLLLQQMTVSEADFDQTQVSVKITNTLDACILDNVANAENIGELGAITSMVRLLGTSDTSSKLKVVLALGHSADLSAMNQLRVVESGGITALIQLLSEGIEPELSRAVRYVLQTCMSSENKKVTSEVENGVVSGSGVAKDSSVHDDLILKKLNSLEEKLKFLNSPASFKDPLSPQLASLTKNINTVQECNKTRATAPVQEYNKTRATAPVQEYNKILVTAPVQEYNKILATAPVQEYNTPSDGSMNMDIRSTDLKKNLLKTIYNSETPLRREIQNIDISAVLNTNSKSGATQSDHAKASCMHNDFPIVNDKNNSSNSYRQLPVMRQNNCEVDELNASFRSNQSRVVRDRCKHQHCYNEEIIHANGHCNSCRDNSCCSDQRMRVPNDTPQDIGNFEMNIPLGNVYDCVPRAGISTSQGTGMKYDVTGQNFDINYRQQALNTPTNGSRQQFNIHDTTKSIYSNNNNCGRTSFGPSRYEVSDRDYYTSPSSNNTPNRPRNYPCPQYRCTRNRDQCLSPESMPVLRPVNTPNRHGNMDDHRRSKPDRPTSRTYFMADSRQKTPGHDVYETQELYPGGARECLSYTFETPTSGRDADSVTGGGDMDSCQKRLRGRLAVQDHLEAIRQEKDALLEELEREKVERQKLDDIAQEMKRSQHQSKNPAASVGGHYDVSVCHQEHGVLAELEKVERQKLDDIAQEMKRRQHQSKNPAASVGGHYDVSVCHQEHDVLAELTNTLPQTMKKVKNADARNIFTESMRSSTPIIRSTASGSASSPHSEGRSKSHRGNCSLKANNASASNTFTSPMAASLVVGTKAMCSVGTNTGRKDFTFAKPQAPIKKQMQLLTPHVKQGKLKQWPERVTKSAQYQPVVMLQSLNDIMLKSLNRDIKRHKIMSDVQSEFDCKLVRTAISQNTNNQCRRKSSGCDKRGSNVKGRTFTPQRGNAAKGNAVYTDGHCNKRYSRKPFVNRTRSTAASVCSLLTEDDMSDETTDWSDTGVSEHCPETKTDAMGGRCPGCVAPETSKQPLNSRTYNIALETNAYTCHKHRTVRKLERQYIQEVKQRLNHQSRLRQSRKRHLQPHKETPRMQQQKHDASVYDFPDTSSDSGRVTPPEREIGLRSWSSKLRPKKAKRKSRIAYSEEEVESLLQGVKKLGKHWNQILCAYKFHSSRTSIDLKDKYKRLMMEDIQLGNGASKTISKPFSLCEERRLRRGVMTYGYNWKAILQNYKFMQGRRNEELRSRWRVMNSRKKRCH